MFDVSPLAGLIQAPAVELDPERIFLDVCAASDVSPDLVRSRSRDQVLIDVRRKAAAALRDAGCTLTEIGQLLRRHHTSVLDLLRK